MNKLMLSLFFLLSLQTNADRNIVCSGKTLITQQWLHVADSAEEGTERNKNIDVIPCFQEWQDTTMIQIPPKSMFSNGHFLFGATSIHSTAFIFVSFHHVTIKLVNDSGKASTFLFSATSNQATTFIFVSIILSYNYLIGKRFKKMSFQTSTTRPLSNQSYIFLL